MHKEQLYTVHFLSDTHFFEHAETYELNMRFKFASFLQQKHLKCATKTNQAAGFKTTIKGEGFVLFVTNRQISGHLLRHNGIALFHEALSYAAKALLEGHNFQVYALPPSNQNDLALDICSIFSKQQYRFCEAPPSELQFFVGLEASRSQQHFFYEMQHSANISFKNPHQSPKSSPMSISAERSTSPKSANSTENDKSPRTPRSLPSRLSLQMDKVPTYEEEKSPGRTQSSSPSRLMRMLSARGKKSPTSPHSPKSARRKRNIFTMRTPSPRDTMSPRSDDSEATESMESPRYYQGGVRPRALTVPELPISAAITRQRSDVSIANIMLVNARAWCSEAGYRCKLYDDKLVVDLGSNIQVHFGKENISTNSDHAATLDPFISYLLSMPYVDVVAIQNINKCASPE